MFDAASPTLEVIRDDITTLKVDAVVNAANSELLAGGGVCGAIHHAAGYLLEEECRSVGYCAPGDAVVTGSYEMKNVKWIIHAVGPIYDGSKKSADLLASVYRAILLQCGHRKIQSVAIPCISTGIYGYPKKDAAEIAVSTIRSHLALARDLERLVFCCFSEEDEYIYRSLDLRTMSP